MLRLFARRILLPQRKRNKYYSTKPYELNLKIEDLSLNKYISRLEVEYEKLKGNNNKDNDKLFQLQPVIEILEKRKETVDNLSNLTALLNENDADLKKLAEEEKLNFEQNLNELDAALKDAVLPFEKEDYIKGIMLEVNAGVGGQEAMLFASEVLEMYTRFISYKNWECEFADHLTTDIGGLRHASLLVNGAGVFQFFKHEAGVHRVQRVPSTEKAGRTHTSTISVLVLPQPDDIQVKIEAKDLKIETKRATGAGGQHVNTTDSAVRILHIPSGIAVECQTDRSQLKNKAIALQKLRAKLYEMQYEEQMAKEEATKKSQVNSNSRNEKIRTYNFPQDRITDHRLNANVYNLKGFMTGGAALEELIEKLDYRRKLELLKERLNDT